MFLLNSRLGLFTAAPLGLLEQVLRPEGAPLLPKLRGYFAEFLNKGSLEHLRILFSPTCVRFRYGRLPNSLEVFLGSMVRASLCPDGLLIASRSWMTSRISLGDPSTSLNRGFQHPADLSLLRYPFVQTSGRWFRNVDLIPITYAFRPGLRDRLTLSGLALLRKP